MGNNYVTLREHSKPMDIEWNHDKKGIGIMELTNHSCRFPFTDGSYCGCVVHRGSYCQEHSELCYREKKHGKA